jgi:vacuolar protein sorting-associated protein 13A/C
MFEGQVAFYLNKYLGTYLEGIDPASLRISVFRGNVELTNLQLKPDALNELDLPIVVKGGLLGSLSLKVGGWVGRGLAQLPREAREFPGKMPLPSLGR